VSAFTTLRGRRAATALAAIATLLAAPLPVRADPNCLPITAPLLQIGQVPCGQVLPQLQASGQFPDVFAGAGKVLGLCYAATGPAPAQIGNIPVTITNTLSAWTTDFNPILVGGPDHLGTVVTQVTVSGSHGLLSAHYYTRDTIDLSQILTTGTAAEEDVIVGGDSLLFGAKGTYRVASQPVNGNPALVDLNNLAGLICTLF